LVRGVVSQWIKVLDEAVYPRCANRHRRQAIALAELAVDRVLLLTHESCVCAYLLSDGVLCSLAAEHSEQACG
jgi:hypothetical protein